MPIMAEVEKGNIRPVPSKSNSEPLLQQNRGHFLHTIVSHSETLLDGGEQGTKGNYLRCIFTQKLELITSLGHTPTCVR